MIEFFDSLEGIDDPRQPWKVKHSMKDILATIQIISEVG
jgi:hypothetical protein